MSRAAAKEQRTVALQELAAYAAAPVARRPVASRGNAVSLVLVVLLGLALPVERKLLLTGVDVNMCAADLLLPFLLLCYRGTWLRSGALGVWLLALWLVNLIAWTLSLSMLEPLIFARELMKVVTCSGYALVGFGIGRDLSREPVLVKSLAWVAIPLALAGVLAFFTGSPAFLIADGRVVGTFTDPNAYGVYLAMLFPLFASLPIGWVLLPALVGGVVATVSRTGLISLTGALGLSVLHVSWRKYIPLLVLSVLALGATFTVAPNLSLIGRIFSYEVSLEQRQSLWTTAWEVATEHPFFGIGRGNYIPLGRAAEIPHNTFLSVASDTGFIGLAVFLLPILVWLWAGLRRPAARRWAITVCITLVGGIAVSFDNFRPFWLAVGVLAGQLSLPVVLGRGVDAGDGGRPAEEAAHAAHAAT